MSKGKTVAIEIELLDRISGGLDRVNKKMDALKSYTDEAKKGLSGLENVSDKAKRMRSGLACLFHEAGYYGGRYCQGRVPEIGGGFKCHAWQC